MRKIKIGLNCRHTYYYEDVKEIDFDDYEVYVVKVSEKAVLIEVRDSYEGTLKLKFWLPLRFTKLRKENECWFLYVDFEKYCKWFNGLKDRRGLIGCGDLLVHFEESPYMSYSPIVVEEKNKNSENPGEIDEYLIEWGIVDPEAEKEERKPEWEEELEKLIKKLKEEEQ